MANATERLRASGSDAQAHAALSLLGGAAETLREAALLVRALVGVESDAGMPITKGLDRLVDAAETLVDAAALRDVPGLERSARDLAAAYQADAGARQQARHSATAVRPTLAVVARGSRAR